MSFYSTTQASKRYNIPIKKLLSLLGYHKLVNGNIPKEELIQAGLGKVDSFEKNGSKIVFGLFHESIWDELLEWDSQMTKKLKKDLTTNNK